jgi:hypothetical protein
MKTFILSITAFLLISIFASCKKSTAASAVVPVNSMTATIGGINYTFHNIAIDTFFVLGGINELTVQGSNDTASIQVSVQTNNKPLTARIYNENDSVYTAGLDFNQGLLENDNSTTNPFTAAITSISATSLHITFQGDIYGFDTAVFKKVITNGVINYNN